MNTSGILTRISQSTRPARPTMLIWRGPECRNWQITDYPFVYSLPMALLPQRFLFFLVVAQPHWENCLLPTILVKSIWYTLKICFVFIIAPRSMIKAALFPKLGPPPSPPYNVASRGTLWAYWPNIVLGGGGKERWNCQKRPSVPLLLTRIVVCSSNLIPNERVFSLTCPNNWTSYCPKLT